MPRSPFFQDGNSPKSIQIIKVTITRSYEKNFIYTDIILRLFDPSSHTHFDIQENICNKQGAKSVDQGFFHLLKRSIHSKKQKNIQREELRRLLLSDAEVQAKLNKLEVSATVPAGIILQYSPTTKTIIKCPSLQVAPVAKLPTEKKIIPYVPPIINESRPLPAALEVFSSDKELQPEAEIKLPVGTHSTFFPQTGGQPLLSRPLNEMPYVPLTPTQLKMVQELHKTVHGSLASFRLFVTPPAEKKKPSELLPEDCNWQEFLNSNLTF
jgi:hypothetical protein